MSNIGFALQLDAGHLDSDSSLADQLLAIRQQGFDYLVWMGDTRPAAAMLDAAQRESRTRIVAAQIPYQQTLSGAREIVEYWAGLRVPDILVDQLPADLTPDDLGALKTALNPGELRISLVLPPEQSIETLRACGLSVAVDTGNSLLAGGDPAMQIRAASDSSPFVILHDVLQAGSEGRPALAPLGEGELDWQAIFDAGEEAAAEWYVAGYRSAAPANPGSLRQAATFLARRA